MVGFLAPAMVAAEEDDAEKDDAVDTRETNRTSVMTQALARLRSDTATAFSHNDSAPWLREDEPPWSSWRIWAGKFIRSPYTEFVLNLIILFNFGLIIFETDEEAKCYPEFESRLGECSTSHQNLRWLGIANDVLLGVYTFEAIAHIYVRRLEYFKNRAHLFDFALCALSWFSKLPQSADFMNLTWLRIVRCIRIVRAMRFAQHNELQMLLSGFKACMKALFFGTLILIGLLCLFSIIAVQFVHPQASQIKYDSCTRCSKGFQSVPDSMLTLYQQIVAGDSWGTISIPIVERTRYGLLLPIFQLVIGLGAMNLILAVVVDQAMEARENNRAATAQKKAETQMQRKVHLLGLIREIDGDTSGDIDRFELLNAAQANRELQTCLALAGLRHEELKEIFDAIASPTDNTVEYMSLCNVLDDIDAVDIRKNVVLTKLLVSSMHRDVNKRLDKNSKELETISRKLDQIVAHGVHGPAHPHLVEQNRSVPSASRISCQQNCPDTVPTDAIDFRLGEPITDKIQSCRAELDCEINCVQESLMRLDTKWCASLRALEEISLGLVDSTEVQEVDVRLLDHAIRTHQFLEQRRCNLSKNFMNDLEDHLGFWTSQYSFLSASENVHADDERRFYEQLMHSRRSKQKLLLL